MVLAFEVVYKSMSLLQGWRFGGDGHDDDDNDDDDASVSGTRLLEYITRQ